MSLPPNCAVGSLSQHARLTGSRRVHLMTATEVPAGALDRAPQAGRSLGKPASSVKAVYPVGLFIASL